MSALRALLLPLAVALLFLATPVVRAEEPVLLDMEISGPDRLTVGDRVTYTISVEVAEGTTVTLAPAALPPELTLVDVPRSETRSLGGGRSELTLTFQVAPFVVGDIEVPPLPLRYSAPDGSSGVVNARSSMISVSSVLPQVGPLAPHDLKPQAEIGSVTVNWVQPVLAGLLAALVVIVLLALLWRFVRRLLARRVRVEEPALLGPEDRARRELDEAGVAFAADGDYVAYYSALAMIVRNYLTERYGFPAFALTTRELEAEMLRRGLDRWQVRVASGLLSQCDAVVYAYYRPAAERADADLTAAYEIVEMSRPEERPFVREEAPVA